MLLPKKSPPQIIFLSELSVAHHLGDRHHYSDKARAFTTFHRYFLETKSHGTNRGQFPEAHLSRDAPSLQNSLWKQVRSDGSRPTTRALVANFLCSRRFSPASLHTTPFDRQEQWGHKLHSLLHILSGLANTTRDPPRQSRHLLSCRFPAASIRSLEICGPNRQDWQSKGVANQLLERLARYTPIGSSQPSILQVYPGRFVAYRRNRETDSVGSIRTCIV